MFVICCCISIGLCRFVTTRQFEIQTNLKTRRLKIKLFRQTQQRLPRVRQRLERKPNTLEIPRPASKKLINQALRAQINPILNPIDLEPTSPLQKEQENDQREDQ